MSEPKTIDLSPNPDTWFPMWLRELENAAKFGSSPHHAGDYKPIRDVLFAARMLVVSIPDLPEELGEQYPDIKAYLDDYRMRYASVRKGIEDAHDIIIVHHEQQYRRENPDEFEDPDAEEDLADQYAAFRPEDLR